MNGETDTFTAVKVHRQCTFVLLVKVERRGVRCSEVENIEMKSGAVMEVSRALLQ
jgi:hypothetical protein